MEFKLSTFKRQKKPQPAMPQLIMLQHLTLFRMSLFGAAHGWGAKSPHLLPKICHAYPAVMQLSTGIPYLKKI